MRELINLIINYVDNDKQSDNWTYEISYYDISNFMRNDYEKPNDERFFNELRCRIREVLRTDVDISLRDDTIRHFKIITIVRKV